MPSILHFSWKNFGEDENNAYLCIRKSVQKKVLRIYARRKLRPKGAQPAKKMLAHG